MAVQKLLAASALALALVPLGAPWNSSGSLSAGGATAAERSTEGFLPAEAPEIRKALPVLKESVSIDGTTVTLGDLFHNAGKYADRTVAHAPAPGRKAVFDARWLYRVAHAYGLKWRPISREQKIIIERVSQIITREEIEDTILAALLDQGAEPDMEIELTNRLARLYVPGNVAAVVGIDDIAYDPRTRRFSALISAPEGDPRAQRIRVTGSLQQVREIPVAAHPIGRGQVIKKADLRFIRVRTSQLRQDTVLDADALIGMSPKRGLRPGFSIRNADVQRPLLVKKGSRVTVSLKYGGMRLSIQGKALDSGAKGEVINIQNLKSRKVVEATVTGTGTVRVDMAASTTRQLAQN